jgi:predicted GIY-YIG superfamily endonuclease
VKMGALQQPFEQLAATSKGPYIVVPDGGGRIRARCIYAITCDATGHAYIGMSTRPRARVLDHYVQLVAGRHSSRLMQAHWNEHGGDAFDWEILDKAHTTMAEASERERCWMRWMFANSGGNWKPYNRRTAYTTKRARTFAAVWESDWRPI